MRTRYRYNPRAIREARERRGEKVRDVAKGTRMTERHIYGLERGATTPSATTLARLATALAISPAAFFTASGDGA